MPMWDSSSRNRCTSTSVSKYVILVDVLELFEYLVPDLLIDWLNRRIPTCSPTFVVIDYSEYISHHV